MWVSQRHCCRYLAVLHTPQGHVVDDNARARRVTVDERL